MRERKIEEEDRRKKKRNKNISSSRTATANTQRTERSINRRAQHSREPAYSRTAANVFDDASVIDQAYS